MNEKHSKKDVKMRGLLERSKSGIAILLVFAMLIMLAAVPITAGAAEGDTNFEYTVLEDGTIQIDKYIGTDTDVIIPEEIDGRKVTVIGWGASIINENVTSVEMPNTVTKLSAGCFNDSTSLEKINLSTNIKIIERGSFGGCISLKDIEIPDNVEIIEWGAFASCTSLSRITIPSKVKEVGEGTFGGCINLESVVIQEGVKRISKYAFTSCTKLSAVYFPKGIEYIDETSFIDTGDNLTAYVYKDTYAQKYSEEHGFNVKLIDDITDPSEIQPTEDTSSDNIITNDENGVPDVALYNILLERCDTNGDGKIEQEEAEALDRLFARYDGVNQITSLQGLNLFKNIALLHIQGYDLQNLNGIEGLNKLYALDVSNNKLNNIDAIKYASENLIGLNVENNNLTDLPDMRNFYNLTFSKDIYGTGLGDSTSFLNNYLTYDELNSKLPEHLKNMTECDGQFDDKIPIYDGKTLLEYWADFQKELPPVTNPTETQPNTDPVETQPADTQPDTDPSETQPADTQPNTDPTETQPADTQPNTDPSETQPADTQPNTDPTETQPAETQPDTDPSETQPADTQPNTDPSETQPAETQPNTNSTEDDTQAETVAPTPGGSDNNGGIDNNGNSNSGNGVNNGNNANSGNSGASSSTGSQGKSAGTVNTGDNYFVFTLAFVAMLASAFVLLKSKRKNKARYK